MAEKETRELWPVDIVKFRESVPSPHNSSQLTTAKSDGKTLRIEFDPKLRVIVITPLAPLKGQKEGELTKYGPHETRKSLSSPIENVLFMQ